MSNKTPPDREALKRIVKAEVAKHGRIRKGSHAAKLQALLDQRQHNCRAAS